MYVCVLTQMTAGGQRDYENYMSKVHKGFRSYQDTTLTKWSNKTRLASGKISSKVVPGLIG